MLGHLGRFLLLSVLVLALPGGAQAAPTWIAPATLDGPTPNVDVDLPAQLRVGSKVTVEITTATAIGRWFAFTIRPKSIKSENGCLVPGARRHLKC